MKKFRFRLERVLQHRKTICEDRKRDLAAKLGELAEVENKIEWIGREVRANKVNEGGPVDVGVFQLAGLYMLRLEEELAQAKLALIRIEEEVDVARKAYIEAAKDEETLQTLKRKRREEYMEYVQNEESKFLDELTTQKGNRLGRD